MRQLLKKILQVQKFRQRKRYSKKRYHDNEEYSEKRRLALRKSIKGTWSFAKD